MDQGLDSSILEFDGSKVYSEVCQFSWAWVTQPRMQRAEEVMWALHKYFFVHVWLEKLGLSWTLGDCIFIRMFQNSGLQQHLGCGEWLTHSGIP